MNHLWSDGFDEADTTMPDDFGLVGRYVRQQHLVSVGVAGLSRFRANQDLSTCDAADLKFQDRRSVGIILDESVELPPGLGVREDRRRALLGG
jgi:hypothetical protein